MALQHPGQFPREVVRVVDTGVAAKTAVGRHYVSGVTGQEDAALAEALGNIGPRLPVHHVLDGYRNVIGAERGMNVFETARFGQPFGDIGFRMGGVANRVDREKARFVRFFDPEKAPQHRVHDHDPRSGFARGSEARQRRGSRW